MADVLNLDLVDVLRELMGDDFSTLVETYQLDAGRQLENIRACREQGDLDGVRRAAHSLKGASANVGASGLAVLCARLEGAARNGDEAALAALIDAVRAEIQRVRQALTRSLLPGGREGTGVS